MIDASNPNFNLAKQQIIYGLEKLARYSAAMDMKFPPFGFKPYAQKLRDLENVLQDSSGPYLSSDEINEVENFAHHLSSSQDFIRNYFVDSRFLFKLEKFWDLRQDNFDRIFSERDILLFYQDYDRLIAIQTSLLNSALITDFLRREFKK